MERRIRITAGAVSMEARLDGGRTAEAIWEALPIEAKAVVEMGDLGYWPPGQAFCIFFGPTPASQGDEIRPASAVNVFGRVVGDATPFKAVRAGTRIRIERHDTREGRE